MESERSLPFSQELATGSGPEPDQSTPYDTIQFLWDPFYYFSTVEAVFSMWSVRRLYNEVYRITPAVNLCGGGVEYLHRDPASRRRRRKGKSEMRE
jgi:hypothetical protein